MVRRLVGHWNATAEADYRLTYHLLTGTVGEAGGNDVWQHWLSRRPMSESENDLPIHDSAVSVIVTSVVSLGYGWR